MFPGGHGGTGLRAGEVDLGLRREELEAQGEVDGGRRWLPFMAVPSWWLPAEREGERAVSSGEIAGKGEEEEEQGKK